MMLQYKHRAFKKPLINSNILKVSFHILPPRQKHISVEISELEINYWDRWKCEEVKWFSLPACQTVLQSLTFKLRLSVAICRMGTLLAHDVEPAVQNARYYQTVTQLYIFCHHLVFRRPRKIAKSDCWLRHVCPSAWKKSAPTGRIFMKLIFEYFFENLSRKFKFHYNVTRIAGTLHGHNYMFFKSYVAELFLEWKMFQTKVVEKNQNTHFVFSNFFWKNRAFCEIMWKNISEPGRPQMTTWHLRIACWIPKTTNTHSEYVILIVSPLKQWLQESALMLRNTYIACLVNTVLLVTLLCSLPVIGVHDTRKKAVPMTSLVFAHSAFV